MKRSPRNAEKHATVAEPADAPASRSGPERGAGSSPAGGTHVSEESLRAFIGDLRSAFEKRSLMYGGDLNGVEAAWHMLEMFQIYLEGDDPCRAGVRDPYAVVAQKYRCGSCVISSKVKHEMGEDPRAAEELIRRLNEVSDLRRKMRQEAAK